MDPVPGLGEHTRSILAELGLSDAEVEVLVADGVV
jgi:crotonobetainyl-CoA:carnitine CoA-transferase CaiB-like acyl-CoA transferase